jgi:membrane protein required for colicin V production
VTINPLDGAVALVIVLSLVLGAWRGFMYELLSILGWVAAFLAARMFAEELAGRLPMSGASPELKLVVAFVGLFVVVAFLAGVVSWLVRKLASASALRPVDRSLGFVFGFARAALILVFTGMVAGATPLAKQEFWMQSTTGEWLLWAGRQAQALLPQDVGKVLN